MSLILPFTGKQNVAWQHLFHPNQVLQLLLSLHQVVQSQWTFQRLVGSLFNLRLVCWYLRLGHMLRFILLEIAKPLLLWFLVVGLGVVVLIVKPVHVLIFVVRNHWAVHLLLDSTVKCIEVISLFYLMLLRWLLLDFWDRLSLLVGRLVFWLDVIVVRNHRFSHLLGCQIIEVREVLFVLLIVLKVF